MSENINKDINPNDPAPEIQENRDDASPLASDKIEETIKPAIDIIEVHHHPEVEKKGFKEYFLEGLMIFLAVMMGFIAENYRESVSDRDREKEFMRSMIKDVLNDEGWIAQEGQFFKQRQLQLDSLVDLLNEPVNTKNTNDLYYFARLTTKSDVFAANTRTIDQMRNAGGFRVIKNDQVAINIMSYYALIPEIKSWEDAEMDEENEFRKIAIQVFNAKVFNQINSTADVLRPVNNPPLLTTDKKILGDMAGWVHYLKNTRIGLHDYKGDLIKKGNQLIRQIKKEYHLENE